MNKPQTTSTIFAPTPRLRQRHRRERLFKRAGFAAILLSLFFVVFLLGTVITDGYSAFRQTYIELEVHFDEKDFSNANLANADFPSMVKNALRHDFPGVTTRDELKQLYALLSTGAAYKLQEMVELNPQLVGSKQKVWVLADDDVDMLMKGKIDRNLVEKDRRIKDNQLAWLDQLSGAGKIALRFNTTFFTSGDSREPELAGIWGAVKGSVYTLILTFALSFPIGVAAAVYLEEFAQQNTWTDLIEVNINNLAAVPSIIYGLLGLAIFINFWGLPRSTPLVGGVVLSLMTLPTIIIASRASLKSVPPSIREAALGIGASKMQTVTHHVIPLALPGMLTGTIIGMAHALGETAPLLMIGMVAFLADIPGSFSDPAAVLPVQIYLWADNPERAFTEKTAATILVLLIFLVVMNSLAIYLRKKFEIKW